jgi:hypothetical protein
MKLRKPAGGVRRRRRNSGAASSVACALHAPCPGRPGSHVSFMLVQHAALESLIVSLAVCFRALPFIAATSASSNGLNIAATRRRSIRRAAALRRFGEVVSAPATR